MIILDGDARLKNTNDPLHKPSVRDYLDKEYQLESGKSEQNYGVNVCFLPDFFAPESFLYRIIYHLYTNPIVFNDFWKAVDEKEETSLYTPEKIRQLFSALPEQYDNSSLKDIFKSPDKQTDAWKFVTKTDAVTYYFLDYKTATVLIEFVDKVLGAYKMAYGNMKANRY